MLHPAHTNTRPQYVYALMQKETMLISAYIRITVHECDRALVGYDNIIIVTIMISTNYMNDS